MTIPALASYALPNKTTFPANKVEWPFDSERAVLLIHDMQEYFVNFYGENSPLMKSVIEHIAALKSFCKAKGIPVVYTAQPADQSPEDRALLNDMWGPGLNVYPESQPVISALTPSDDDTVLVKWRYSAFQRSPLTEMMQQWQRDQLLVCGIYGHIGCLMTAADAFMRDIKPFLIGDAIADFSLEEHHQALDYVAGRCGRVVGVEDIISESPRLNTEPMTRSELLTTILNLIDESEDEFDADESLIDYGLDSVQIMELISQWRLSGIELSFVDLAEVPSFNGWWQLITQQQSGRIEGV